MSKKAQTALACVAGTALAVIPGEVAKDVKTVENTPVETQNSQQVQVLHAGDAGKQKPAVGQDKRLFVKVTTTDLTKKGLIIGERIVDMYHMGTKNWLQNHMWWAMHNGHLVESEVASEDDVKSYIDDNRAKLAAKFNAA